ncbi:MAG: hypothetical protein ACT4PI_01110 [Actinomycetota bacterium]
MRYEIAFRGEIAAAHDAAPPVADKLEPFLDDVVSELEKMHAQDISVSADVETGSFRVSVSLQAKDVSEAHQRGDSLIRSAFHAAGLLTPEWEVDWIEVSASRQGDLVDAS